MHQLKPPPQHFTGRAEALAELCAVLGRGEDEQQGVKSAVITAVNGMGGVGKTALALMAGHALREDYPDMQLLLELRSHSPNPLSAGQVRDSVLLAANPLQWLPDDEDARWRLYANLFYDMETGKPLRALVIIDDAADESQVESLSPPPGCALLVTSRRQLMTGEPLHLDRLPRLDAMALLRAFTQRLNNAQADNLAILCGDLPVALKTAGGYLKAYRSKPVADYLAELQHNRLHRLANPNQPADDVNRVFEASFHALTDAERRAWTALAVMPADFDREAGKTVIAAVVDEFPAGVISRPLMQGLQETNMSESFHVFLSHNSQDKPIVRKLAQALKLYDLQVWLDEEQLVPGQIWQEGLETIIKTTQAAAVLIGNSGLGPWENPEMRACLNEFVNRKLPVIPVLLPGTTAPELPLFLRSFTWVDLSDGLTDLGLEKLVWGITGVKPAKPSRLAGGGLHPFPATDLLDRLVHLNLLDFAEDKLRYCWHDLLKEFASARLFAKQSEQARLRHAEYYTEVARQSQALYLKEDPEFILQGLELFDQELTHLKSAVSFLADDLRWAKPFIRLVDCIIQIGSLRFHPRSLIRWLEAQVTAAQREGDRESESNALGNLGNAYLELSKPREAIKYYEQSLVIHREIGNLKGEGNDYGNLANACLCLEELQEAIEFYNQQLIFAQKSHDRRGKGNALCNLGVAYRHLHDYPKAIECYEKALVIHQEAGDLRDMGSDLCNLGVAYYSLNELHKAMEYYEQHLSISRKIGDRLGEGKALGNLGNAYRDQGKPVKAIEYYNLCLIIQRERCDLRGEGITLWNSALAYKNLGEWAQALNCGTQALAIYKAIEDNNAIMVREVLERWRGEDGGKAGEAGVLSLN